MTNLPYGKPLFSDLLRQAYSQNQMKPKVQVAVETLKTQGHTVRPYKREGQSWYEIDGRMLVSHQEMEDLADRVYSLLELEDLFVQMRKEEENN
jgi:hypothetical protein